MGPYCTQGRRESPPEALQLARSGAGIGAAEDSRPLGQQPHRRELRPLREAIVRDGATIISDGWDNVSKDHLINCLYGNASCLLFDGTVQIESDDSDISETLS